MARRPCAVAADHALGAVLDETSGRAPAVSIVMMTRDRRDRVLATMSHLATASSDGVEVVVVDNGSVDGTPEAVRARWPGVQVVELGRNAGAVARNVGVRVARSEIVAFADDDSWWAPGALDRARELFDANPRLGLLAARVLVGPDERLDPVSAEMAASPLPPSPDAPGPRVLGFVACGAVVRRPSFLEVGGFDDVVEFPGEEERVAIDLSAAGWVLAYVPEVVAHHHPETSDRGAARHRRLARNWVLTACLRRPWRVVASRVVHSPVRAVIQAVPRMPAAIARRRPAPASVEAELRLLERPGRSVGRRDTGRPAAAGPSDAEKPATLRPAAPR